MVELVTTEEFNLGAITTAQKISLEESQRIIAKAKLTIDKTRKLIASRSQEMEQCQKQILKR